jgi:bifunctional enzyme CysN/CysC
VASNEVAEVLVRTAKAIAIDPHLESAALGRFVIVDQSDIAGGGIVTRIDAAPAVAALVEVRADRLVTQAEREARTGHRGAVVWFTGLSGAGKSTIANALERALFDRGQQVFVLDGDNIRMGLSADLGFSLADRSENIRRIAEVAKLFAESGAIVITAFISPYASDRVRARRIIAQSGLDVPFVEVHVDAPIAVCEARDPKGLYAKARDGRIKQFTGVSDPYEAPDHPEVVLLTAEQSVEASVDQLLTYLQPLLTTRRSQSPESSGPDRP